MIRTQTGLQEKAASHKSEGAVTGTEEQEKVLHQNLQALSVEGLCAPKDHALKTETMAVTMQEGKDRHCGHLGPSEALQKRLLCALWDAERSIDLYRSIESPLVTRNCPNGEAWGEVAIYTNHI